MGSQPVVGVYSAREQDSSVGGIGVVHMEEEVEVRVQVEVGREEQGEGAHGKGQRGSKQQGTNAQPLIMNGVEME